MLTVEQLERKLRKMHAELVQQKAEWQPGIKAAALQGRLDAIQEILDWIQKRK